MGKLNFTKMVGAGNDFIVIDTRLNAQGSRLKGYVKRLCERKTGIGADGVLVLEKSKAADFKMRIFNADGSVAEMCGNGLRCAILFSGIRRKVKVETKAGIYEGEITGKDKVRIKMGEPKGLRLNFPINVNGRTLNVNFINTGVPHTVVFVEGLDKIDVYSIGSAIRYHNDFKPRGTNVNFVEIIDDDNIRIRTYERGVEMETLACGTGAVASAIVSNRQQATSNKVNVHARGGILKVYFDRVDNEIKKVYLEGGTKEVFRGVIKT